MSNQELKAYNERRNLESNYKRLNPNAYERGKKIAKGSLAVIGAVGTIAALSDSVPKLQKTLNMGKEGVKKVFRRG